MVSWLAAALIFLSPMARAEVSETTSSVKTDLSQNISPKKKRIGLISAGWTLSLDAESFADTHEQAQTTGLGLLGDVRYRLLPALEMKAAARLSLESGYAQSRFGDNTPNSGVSLKEAVLVLKPFQGASLQGGAIDQGHLNSKLLVDSQPFPGVLERYIFGSHAFNVELKAEQTIPTSKTLSTKAIEAETTPSFTTETLALRSRPMESLELLAFGTHYAFHNLPSTVAVESERYGNTVTSMTAKTGHFAYEFDGYVAGAESKVGISRGLKWGVEGEILKNLKADDSFGDAQTLMTSLEMALPGDIDLIPRAGVFFTESDVSPGFYNAADLGHNNRTGWTAGVETVFKQSGFKLGGDFVHSDLINPSSIQSALTYFQIRFETLHELL